MRCPACGNLLQQVKAGDITLDACVGGCGGIWFDQLELKRFEARHESTGEALLRLPVNPAAPVNVQGKRQCPRCDDQAMLRFFYSPHRSVTVDHCPNCGGHWLDAGELATIQDVYSNDEQRGREITGFIEAAFGEQFEQLEADRQKRLERARPLRRMFGFLLPKR